MVLWFVSYTTFPIIVIVSDISIVIVYEVSLGKTDCTDLWVIKQTNQVSPSSGIHDPHYDQNVCVSLSKEI